MRVEAVWVEPEDLGPSMASVKYFRPTGEPDAALRDVQGVPMMPSRQAAGRLPSPPSPSPRTSVGTRSATRSKMLMPVIGEVFANIGITKDDIDFICSG